MALQAGEAPTIPLDIDPAVNAAAENSPAGTTVGVTMAATDPDGAAISYTIGPVVAGWSYYDYSYMAIPNDLGIVQSITARVSAITVAPSLPWIRATSGLP